MAAAAPMAAAAEPNLGGQYDLPYQLAPYYSQDITWGDCDDGDPTAQCATLEVPLDYSDTSAGTITLALKMIPASDGDAELGSLFTNPGGPGGSGVQSVASIAHELDSDVRAAYDVIGFDPRGIGGSTPITCWSEEELDAVLAQASGGQLAQPDESTADPADTTHAADAEEAVEEPAGPDAAGQVAAGQELAARCAQYSEVPEILDHMSTNDVVHDLDLMRAVVGDERLNYLGISYGTYLGAEYLEDFPLNAGAMVLDSAMDPSISMTQIHDDNIAHYEYQLRTFVEQWMDTGDSPLSGTPEEGKNELAEWIAGLDAAPLPVEGTTDTVDSATALSWVTDVTVYTHRDYWPTLMDGLADAMLNGDGTALAQSYAAIKTAANGGQEIVQTSEAPTREDLVSAWNSAFAFLGVDCTDHAVEGDEASWDAHAAEVQAAWPVNAGKTLPFFTGISVNQSYMQAVCAGWGHNEEAESPAPIHGTGSPDVLVTGNYDDFATPYPWAEALVSQLDNGRLLTVNAPIHGSLRNSCARSSISDFLVDGTLPRYGTVCPAEPRYPVVPPAPTGS